MTTTPAVFSRPMPEALEKLRAAMAGPFMTSRQLTDYSDDPGPLRRVRMPSRRPVVLRLR